MNTIKLLFHNFFPLLLAFTLSLIIAGYYHATSPPHFDIQPNTSSPPSPFLTELTTSLDRFLPEEGRGKTRIIPLAKDPSQYLILCKFTLNPNHENEQRDMEKIARDFIFASYEAAYAHNFNLISSTIFIKTPTGKPGLNIGLGKKQANTFDRSIWSDRTTSPAKFIAWMNENKHNAPDAFQKCSYSGIYAKQKKD